MMAYLDIGPWVTEHWWLAFWLAFWALVFAFILVVGVFKAVAVLANRTLRSIKVLARGWPPAHLDADGDWKPAPAPPKRDVLQLARDAGAAIYAHRTAPGSPAVAFGDESWARFAEAVNKEP